MKKSIIYITIAGIFIAGGIITGCGSSSNENGNSQSTQQQQHSEEGGQHAEESGDHSSEEGQHSPESGGQHQEGGGHTGQVHLTEQQRQNLGINVETLDSGSAA